MSWEGGKKRISEGSKKEKCYLWIESKYLHAKKFVPAPEVTNSR
jgi:phage/plasmid primase-like uncharacterized protein